RHKTMSKIVEGMAKLTWTGLLLKLFGIQPKPKISTCHGQGLRIRFSGKLNLTLLPVIGCINPIVHVKSKIGDLGFLIVLKKAGEKNLLFIRLAIAIGIFHRSEEHTSELQSRENLVC